jgi:hypothetical protein
MDIDVTTRQTGRWPAAGPLTTNEGRIAAVRRGCRSGTQVTKSFRASKRKVRDTTTHTIHRTHLFVVSLCAFGLARDRFGTWEELVGHRYFSAPFAFTQSYLIPLYLSRAHIMWKTPQVRASRAHPLSLPARH